MTTGVEHLDVLIVGAGLSGIGAAHHVQHECPWADYAVFEARDGMGGTWDLFRYPGIRSDSDMFTFSYPFRPWTRTVRSVTARPSSTTSRDTATEFGIDRHIRFRHRVLAADWSSEHGYWHVRAERTDASGTVEEVELTCSFLFSCTGYYRYDRGHVPDFPGMDDFRGTIAHPQHWPQDLDYDGRRVVVIGSGATAMTLVPSMAERAGHVTMLQRSPTYVASLPGTNPLTRLIRKVVPRRRQGAALRWTNALLTQSSYRLSKRWPGVVRRVLIEGVRRQLPEGFDVATHFTPRYDPWDQRLCVVPDGDLFRSIREGRTSVVTDRIRTFTPTGLRLESGVELDADIIVPATGLELLFLGGIDLRVDGEPVDPADRLAYKGLMLEGVPNLAMAVGYTNASWTLKSDLTCRYVARLLNHLHRTGAVQCTPVNRDPSMATAPLLGLTAGYITRAQDRFPRQGSRFPWQMHQSYLADHRVMERGGVADDPELVFSRPRVSSAEPDRERSVRSA